MDQEMQIAVFFDIGDVMVNVKSLTASAAHDAAIRCQAMGFDVSAADLTPAYLLCDGQIHVPHMNHLFGDRLIASQAIDGLNRHEDIRLVGAFLTFYRESIRRMLQPDVSLTHLLQSLYAQGHITLGIISDGTTEEQLETLVRLEIIRFFQPELLLISEDVGSEKVDRRIFLEAIRRSGKSPQQIVMIGDNYQRDVLYAKEVGIKTIHFTRYLPRPIAYMDGPPDCVVASFEGVFQFIEAMGRESESE